MRATSWSIVVAVLLGAVACSGGPPDHVRIGLIAPLTGPRAYLGQEVRDGAELAVEDLNRTGGLLGEPVELVVIDDSDLLDLPRQLADLAERSRVSAVVGPEAPAVVLGRRSPLSRRDVPALLATAFGGDLGEAGTVVVRTVPSARDQAETLARWLLEVRDIHRTAVLLADPVEPARLADDLTDGLRAGGVEVAGLVEADPQATDLGPAIGRLRRDAGDAGALLLWAAPPVAARATLAVRSQGWDVQIAVPATAFVGEYRTLARGASEGVVLPFPFREQWFTPVMEDWLLRWSREHGLGALPDLDTLVLDLPVAGLAAYDAVGLVGAAVEAAGSRVPADVADALGSVRYEGLLRPYDLEHADGETWDVDDLHIARFHHYAVVYDVDPRLDEERQRDFYSYQVQLRYLPDDVLEGPGGELIRQLLREGRAAAPPYQPPAPPPGPVAAPDRS